MPHVGQNQHGICSMTLAMAAELSTLNFELEIFLVELRVVQARAQG
jgi:hypothetical protein